jgi:N-methylhydantoinase A
MRYQGQSYELTIPFTPEIENAALCLADPLPLDRMALQEAVDAFHAAHEQRYGYAMRDETVQVVTLRVKASVPGRVPDLPREEPTGPDARTARLADKPVWFANQSSPGDQSTNPLTGSITTNCYDRARLHAGNQLAGPAMIFQYDATVVIAPGWYGTVDAYQNLWLTRESRSVA